MVTPSQCRAARGLVDLSQQQLAYAAKVGLSTIRNFEAARTLPMTNNLEAIVRALETAGVEFIPENGGGAGVRLKQRIGSDDVPKSVGPATDAVEAMNAAIKEHRFRRKKK